MLTDPTKPKKGRTKKEEQQPPPPPDMGRPQGGLTMVFCRGVTVTANKLANLLI